MKTLSSLAPALAALAVCAACTRTDFRDSAPFPEPEGQELHLTVRAAPDSKSVLPSSLETDIRTLLLVFCRKDNPSQWKCLYKNGNSGPVSTTVPMGDYSVYALVNMENVLTDIPRKSSGEPDWERFGYTIPSYGSLQQKGMPMCGKLDITREDLRRTASHTLSVERLMARVQVTVDHTGITGGRDGVAMANTAVYMRNVARVLHPFAPASQRRARSTDEIFSGTTDWEAFRSSTSMNNQSETLVFYVPENCQGQLLSTDLQWHKSADYMDAGEAALCTYLEFTATKKGEDDGVSGGFTYRCYLGANATNDFSVRRNTVYSTRLRLSWDGLFTDNAWRIDSDNLSDKRQLQWLDEEGKTLSSLPLGQGTSKTVYALYSTDGGTHGVHGRKDLQEFPYGWKLHCVNKVVSNAAAGHSLGEGFTVRYSGETTVAGKAVTAFTFQASADAVLSGNQPYWLILESFDGEISATLRVSVVSLNFQGIWEGGEAPRYVGQRGLLRCYDPSTGSYSAEGRFDVTNEDTIQIKDNGDGTAYVSIIAPIEDESDGVYICKSDGSRRCDIPLEGILPYFKCQGTDEALCVDGTFTGYMSFYSQPPANASEEVLYGFSLVDDAVACGNKLRYSLVDLHLRPRMSPNNLLDIRSVFQHSQNAVGFRYDLKTYNGLSFGSGSSTSVNFQVSMGGYTARGTATCTLKLQNPFSNIGTPEKGKVMNDYTLFRYPSNDTGWAESTQNSAKSYTETASFTMTLPPARVADKSHLGLQACFADDGRLMGTVLLSGTPDTQSSTTVTYSLKGIAEDQLSNHGAGRVNFKLTVRNAYDGSLLSATFGYAYVRLHAFIFGEVVWSQGSGRIYTYANILSGEPEVDGDALLPPTLHLKVAGKLRAPNYPYITGSPSDEDDEYLLNATMENDGDTSVSLPVSNGQDRHQSDCQCTWTLPEALSTVAAAKRAEYLKAVVRRSVLPYQFSSLYGTLSYYRKDDTTLYYAPDSSYTDPDDSNPNTNKLIVFHILEGVTEDCTSFYENYPAAPQSGNCGWYFSSANQTAMW